MLPYGWQNRPPVETPPLVLRNFGMPTPANNPPSCGGAGGAPPLPAASLLLLALFGTDGGPPPLLLRALFTAAAAILGIGGAPPGIGGGFPMVIPPAPPAGFPATVGAERSLVTAFFSLIPFVMSLLSAPCDWIVSLACRSGGAARTRSAAFPVGRDGSAPGGPPAKPGGGGGGGGGGAGMADGGQLLGVEGEETAAGLKGWRWAAQPRCDACDVRVVARATGVVMLRRNRQP